MGKRIAAKITGVGGYVPPQVLTNADIAKLVDTNDQWIRERTGISERHIVEPGVATSHLATAAAQTVLEKTHTAPAEIDLIIVATVTPDMLFPATACLVQNRIGASRAWGFDLSGACSGFLYALTVGAQFVGAGMHRKALVIGADMTDRFGEKCSSASHTASRPQRSAESTMSKAFSNACASLMAAERSNS